jgi:hypothetical protein
MEFAGSAVSVHEQLEELKSRQDTQHAIIKYICKAGPVQGPFKQSQIVAKTC